MKSKNDHATRNVQFGAWIDGRSWRCHCNGPAQVTEALAFYCGFCKVYRPTEPAPCTSDVSVDVVEQTAKARDKAGWAAWDRATSILDAAAGDMPQPWRNVAIALLAQNHPAIVVADVLATLRCVASSIPDSAWNHQAMMERAIATLEQLKQTPESNTDNPEVDKKSKTCDDCEAARARIATLESALRRVGRGV